MMNDGSIRIDYIRNECEDHIARLGIPQYQHAAVQVSDGQPNPPIRAEATRK